MDTLKAFLALPVIAELANLTTEKTHLKPIHFAVEAGHKEVTAQLVDLTEEYKGQDSASVFESVKKQFDAAKTETTPAVKPEVKLTTSTTKRLSSTLQRLWRSILMRRGMNRESL